MDQRVRFDNIYIIESAEGYAARTGWRLFEELEPLAQAQTPSITTHYRLVAKRAELLTLLAEIAADARQHGQSPLLHFEAHGGFDSIELSSGEEVTWLDLKPHLTSINEAGRFNLVVFMAACMGGDLLKIVYPGERSPLRLLIGPMQPLRAGQIEIATRTFYRTMFAKSSGAEGWRAMNAVLGGDKLAFRAFPAEFVFRWIMNAYFRRACSEPMLSRRIERGVAKLAAEGRLPYGPDHARATFGAYLLNHQPHFDRFRREFFFCDVLPENEHRFNVTLDDCLRDPSPA